MRMSTHPMPGSARAAVSIAPLTSALYMSCIDRLRKATSWMGGCVLVSFNFRFLHGQVVTYAKDKGRVQSN